MIPVRRIIKLAGAALVGTVLLLVPALARPGASKPWLALLGLALAVASHDLVIYRLEYAKWTESRPSKAFLVRRLIGSLLLMLPTGLAIVWLDRLPRLASKEGILILAALAGILLVRFIRQSLNLLRNRKANDEHTAN